MRRLVAVPAIATRSESLIPSGSCACACGLFSCSLTSPLLKSPPSQLTRPSSGASPAEGFAPSTRALTALVGQARPSLTAPPWGSISAACCTGGGSGDGGCSRTLSSPPWGSGGYPLEGGGGGWSLMPPFPPKVPLVTGTLVRLSDGSITCEQLFVKRVIKDYQRFARMITGYHGFALIIMD